MNYRLHNLAEKIDDINYEYDHYNYMDTIVETTSIISEARRKEVDRIYSTLLEGNTSDFIQYLNDIIEEVDGEINFVLLHKAISTLRELNQLNS